MCPLYFLTPDLQGHMRSGADSSAHWWSLILTEYIHSFNCYMFVCFLLYIKTAQKQLLVTCKNSW